GGGEAVGGGVVGAVAGGGQGEARPLHVPPPCRGQAARADGRRHGSGAAGRGTVPVLHSPHRHVGGNDPPISRASAVTSRWSPRPRSSGSQRSRAIGGGSTSGCCPLPTAASSVTIMARTRTGSRYRS